MTNQLFKKPLLISLAGHLTVLSIFSFSFGPKAPQVNFSTVSFWGSVLKGYDFLSLSLGAQEIKRKSAFCLEPSQEALRPSFTEKSRTLIDRSGFYSKPKVTGTFLKEKLDWLPAAEPLVNPLRKKEAVVMLHPALPYYFNLYFKDRQVVHIELEFNIASANPANPVILKRKIASGNLEVDLLAMHYINHYLFIQKFAFPTDKWQNVKIEFSPNKQ